MPRKSSEWIESFQIFEKYGCTDGIAAAEHDEVFAGPDDISIISDEDRVRLEALGWNESAYGSGYQTFI